MSNEENMQIEKIISINLIYLPQDRKKITILFW